MVNRNIFKVVSLNMFMVSLYDVFYVVAKNGSINIRDILIGLGKDKREYQNIFNNILLLEKKHLVKRKNKKIDIINSKSSQELYNLISFSLGNNINHNILFKPKMLNFLRYAARKEFFTISDIKIHPETFKFYTDALSKYGLLIIISRNPLKCKLLKSEYIRRVLKHFNIKTDFYKEKSRSHIPDIKRELMKYHRNIKINTSFADAIDKQRETGFIYSSLNLEGNPLTLPETEKLLIKNILPKDQKAESVMETLNYKKAIEKMLANSKKRVMLNQSLILEYHDLAMSGKEFAGKLRRENVFIKKNPAFTTSHWKYVEKKLGELLKKYVIFENAKQDIENVIQFASYFHNEFQRIHPFIDGNSRISRLLMLHILRAHKLPVLDLPLGYFDSYLNLTKRSKKRDDERFSMLVEEIVLTNLKNLNNAYLMAKS